MPGRALALAPASNPPAPRAGSGPTAGAALLRAGGPAPTPRPQWHAGWHLVLLALLLALAAVAPAWAQEMVSARNPTINMRAGPNANAEVLWRLARGYPLQVLERRGDWLRVQDFEGDQGWVARSVVGETPHHIVRSARANLRAGPGTQHRVLDTVVYGDILRTVRRQGDWVQVQRPDGRGNAWVASELVWGW